MNRAGILLDTGPLVALISKHDRAHDRAKRLFADCQAPFRTCEAVIAEACFLLRKVGSGGPAEVLGLARKRLYEIAISVADQCATIESVLLRYENRPVSLADACLIRCAELFEEPRILTFDSDFRIYRWARNRCFELL